MLPESSAELGSATFTKSTCPGAAWKAACALAEAPSVSVLDTDGVDTEVQAEAFGTEGRGCPRSSAYCVAVAPGLANGDSSARRSPCRRMHAALLYGLSLVTPRELTVVEHEKCLVCVGRMRALVPKKPATELDSASDNRYHGLLDQNMPRLTGNRALLFSCLSMSLS